MHESEPDYRVCPDPAGQNVQGRAAVSKPRRSIRPAAGRRASFHRRDGEYAKFTLLLAWNGLEPHKAFLFRVRRRKYEDQGRSSVCPVAAIFSHQNDTIGNRFEIRQVPRIRVGPIPGRLDHVQHRWRIDHTTGKRDVQWRAHYSCWPHLRPRVATRQRALCMDRTGRLRIKVWIRLYKLSRVHKLESWPATAYAWWKFLPVKT